MTCVMIERLRREKYVAVAVVVVINRLDERVRLAYNKTIYKTPPGIKRVKGAAKGTGVSAGAIG